MFTKEDRAHQLALLAVDKCVDINKKEFHAENGDEVLVGSATSTYNMAYERILKEIK